MSLPSPGVITAVAVLVSLLDAGPLRHSTLLDRCSRSGLRGGALPFVKGLEFSGEVGLLGLDDVISLTELGRAAADLLDHGEEPTRRFRQLITSLGLTTPSARPSLAGVDVAQDGAVTDPRGISAPLLLRLEEEGLIKRSADGWLVDSQSRVLTIGPLLDQGSTGPDLELLSLLGQRGEQLSVLFEADRTGSPPFQVSKVSASFGYDLLSKHSRSKERRLAVEVKATSGAALRFIWSRHEALVADSLQGDYELQVWGQVNLTASLVDDYSRLVKMGYPVRLRNPIAGGDSAFKESLHWTPFDAGRWAAASFEWELHPSRLNP